MTPSELVINVPARIDGHLVEIRCENAVYMGMVYGCNYGQGKTRRAAETGIRKRLEYLSTNSGHVFQLLGSAMEADMADKELARRAKADKWKRHVR